jgi:hypothetical protein
VIEILYFDGCPNHDGLAAHIRSLMAEREIGVPIALRRIDSDRQAEAEHFLGSPTIRVNGVDIDPTAPTDRSYGLTCRIYATATGMRGTPPDEWIIAALDRLRLRPPGPAQRRACAAP